MTTHAQDIVIDRIASEYGGTKVKPLVLDGMEFAAVAVCGWDSASPGVYNKRRGPWVIVADDGTETVLLDVES